MHRSIRRSAPLAAAALVAAVTAALSVATPAHAQDDTAVARVKKQVTERIDLRLQALERGEALLDRKKHLTAAHRDTLGDLIDADVAGLTALKTKVAGETTLAALKADATSMVDDYRIFILVMPTLRLTAVADTEATAVDRLQAAHDKLAGLAGAEGALAVMQKSIDEAEDGLDGQVEALLALKPGPDGQAIRDAVGKIRKALREVRADLRAAVAAAKKARDLIK